MLYADVCNSLSELTECLVWQEFLSGPKLFAGSGQRDCLGAGLVFEATAA